MVHILSAFTCAQKRGNVMNIYEFNQLLLIASIFELFVILSLLGMKRGKR